MISKYVLPQYGYLNAVVTWYLDLVAVFRSFIHAFLTAILDSSVLCYCKVGGNGGSYILHVLRRFRTGLGWPVMTGFGRVCVLNHIIIIYYMVHCSLSLQGFKDITLAPKINTIKFEMKCQQIRRHSQSTKQIRRVILSYADRSRSLVLQCEVH